ASRILTRSIIAASMIPTPTALAFRSISSKSQVRSSGLSRFESSSPSIIRSGRSITAAATTGPANGPRPASSTPATRLSPRRHAARSKRYGAGAVVALRREPGPLARLLASRRFHGSRHLGRSLLLEPRRLAGQFPEIVELGSSHRGTLDHLDLVDPGRVQREGTLHAHSIRDAPDREGCPGAATALSDHHSLESLQSLLLSLDDLDEHLHGVPGFESSPVLLQLCCIHDADRLHDAAPCLLGSLS